MQKYVLAVDVDNSVYTAGSFTGSADFNPGIADEIYDADVNDFFLTKTSANGTYQWTKVYQSDDYNNAYAAAVDRKGNIYIAGDFRDTLDFDPGPGEDIRTASWTISPFIT